MIITSAELYQLQIPFKLAFNHTRADRLCSDSIILKLTGVAKSGAQYTGWGEAVIREYVSGKLESNKKFIETVSAAIRSLLDPFISRQLTEDQILSELSDCKPAENELPLLCAVETALMDLLCTASGSDIYSLLGRSPAREIIIYGGTLPLLPTPAAEKLLGGYKKLGITNLRVKIGSDPEYNKKTLLLVRKIMGENYDIKVDTNAGWTFDDAIINIPLLRELGVKIIEEPFGKENSGCGNTLCRLIKSGNTDGIIFMADESALTAEDLKTAAKEKTFGMANIRLAKNGGLLKALEMAEAAEKLGIRYMSGCHVGETGILSAAGRLASSLMKTPEYTDGSYDSHLLTGNITEDDLSFGPGGKANIIRNKGLGFRIDENKLEGFTHERINCL